MPTGLAAPSQNFSPAQRGLTAISPYGVAEGYLACGGPSRKSGNNGNLMAGGNGLPVTTLKAITPFTPGSQRLRKPFELIMKWNLEPFSLL
jgi:hypothetical protein